MWSVTDAWQQAYPGAAVGILVMREVVNPAEHAELEQRKGELERGLVERFAGRDRATIRALPRIVAYDAYYNRFKKTYAVQLQLESVALKGKSIPRVAALVEAMFMAELKNQMLTAGHDLAAVKLPVQIDVARGSERYTMLNGQEQTLKAGDMHMTDGEGVISSVIYGPDQRTRIGPATTDAMFVVYAPAGIGAEAVRQHLEDIQANVQLVAPAAVVELLEVRSAA